MDKDPGQEHLGTLWPNKLASWMCKLGCGEGWAEGLILELSSFIFKHAMAVHDQLCTCSS